MFFLFIPSICFFFPSPLSCICFCATLPHSVMCLICVAECRSFGFTEPPRVHLKISLKETKPTPSKSKTAGGYSADNPYGVDQKGQKRNKAPATAPSASTASAASAASGGDDEGDESASDAGGSGAKKGFHKGRGHMKKKGRQIAKVAGESGRQWSR
jgi:hypothetical protein